MTAPIAPTTRLAPETRWVTDVAGAALTMAAVLTALGVAVGLRALAGFSAQNVVLAVVLTMTLSRTMRRAAHHPVLLIIEIPLVGVAAAGAGWLVLHEPWVGQPLLVIALSVGIFARRYGGLVRQAGRLVALPFLALLITPAPTAGASGPALPSVVSTMLWAPVVSLVALACAATAHVVQERWRPDRPSRSAPPAPARSRRRLDAPTRMAVQMAVGLGAGLALGHLFFGEHWAWTAVSAFLVASGNRGRGDVAHKAALRVAGAGIGTIAATGLALSLPVGNRWSLVGLFVVLAVALALRERSYAFWAGGVTAMLALLHSYYGGTGTSALQERVLGVVLGSAIGLAAAWFVLPVRTGDVLRRRIADCLAALTDDLDPDSDSGPSVLPDRLRGLDEIAPALRAHRRTAGRRAELHPLDAVAALHRLAGPVADERARRRLRRDVVRVRRAMIGKDDPRPGELPPDLGIVHAVLQTTARTR